MNWQILILGQAFLVALSMIVTRLLAKQNKTRSASLVVTAGWLAVLYVFGLGFLPWLEPIDCANFIEYFWRFALGGLAFGLAGIFTYKMLVHLDAAVGSILTTLNTLFTVVGAALLLNEDLNTVQLIGGVLLVLSVVYGLLASHHLHTKKVRFHRSALVGGAYALATALSFSVAVLNEKSLLGHVSTGDYVLFGWGWQVVVGLAIALAFQRKSFKLLMNSRILFWVVILGILRAFSGLFYMLAQVKSDNVALVTVVSNYRLIIVVVLGYWLLHERQKLRQRIIASVAATLSLTLLFWH